MKKSLIPVVSATSAIALSTASATLSVSQTRAAEIEMEVGGYFESQVAYTGSDHDGIEAAFAPEYSGVDVKRDAEIHFKPSVTLDNGIRFGATIELEAATNGDQIDEAYLSIDGKFGRVVIGSENSARYLMHYAAPDVTFFGANSGDVSNYIPFSGSIGTFDDGESMIRQFNGGLQNEREAFEGIYGIMLETTQDVVNPAVLSSGGQSNQVAVTQIRTPNPDPAGAVLGHDLFLGTLGATFVENRANNDAERITWFTSRVEGWQLGTSYARDDMQDDNSQVDNDGEDLANIVDFGINYVGTVGPVELAVSGGYGTAFGDEGANPKVWNTGLNFGWQGWTIGGSFAEQNNGSNMDGTAYDAGLAYKTGPFGVSFTYFHGENVDNEYNPDADTVGLREISSGNIVSIIDQPGDGEHLGQKGVDETHTMFLIGLNYDLAKGVRLNAFGAYGLFEEDTGDEGGAGDNVDGYVIGTGVRINF